MRSLIATALTLVLGLLSLPAGQAHAAPDVTRFSDGLSPGSKPTRVAAGPDGNVWFTDTSGARVGRITPGGAITEFDIGGAGLSKANGIAAGADGNLWFTDKDADAIGRITPAGVVTAFASGLPSKSDPEGITAGPDGNVWFTLKKNPGHIGRITPAGVITTFNSGLTANKKPMAITAGADGNLWFSTEKGIVGRITPAGVITEFTGGLPNAHIHGMAAGPDGNVWFTVEKHPGEIGRITPSGVITLFSAGLTSAKEPYDIAAGADGALWFTLRKAPGLLGRITTAGVVTEYSAGLAGADKPQGVVTGADGNVWFALGQSDGALMRASVSSGGGSGGSGGGGSGGPATPGTPRIEEVVVDPVGRTSATISTSVLTNGVDTSVLLEYGPGEELTSASAAKAISGSSSASTVTNVISALAPGNTYSLRVVAQSEHATVQTQRVTFTTTGTAIPGAPPFSPVTGKKVVVVPASGVVRIRVPGTDRFIDLADAAGQVPNGSTIDARRGRVALTTALPNESTQTATLWAGAFKVFQSRRRKGLTEFRLTGGHSSVCRAAPKAKRKQNGFVEQAKRRGATNARARSRARARRAVQRRLWVRDKRGLFRTRGRNSVATVRGTKWLTVDRCDGTLTYVKEGSVVVRDLRRKRHRLVRAGKSYFAPKTAPSRRRR